jgi:HSP20 family protein
MSKITKYSPFVLKSSVNNLFDDFFNLPTHFEGEDCLQNINLDVTEDDNTYYISADVAGVKEKDINIELDKGLLTVKATKEHKHKDKKHHIQERYYGEYQRTIRLPDTIDSDKVEAKYNNGVLNISLPKTEKTETVKKIAISS